jgi:DNA excision repair protein ERCC-6
MLDVSNVVKTTSSLVHSPFGLVILVTYEGLRNYRQALLQVPWASVCLDEGQKVRNPEAETTAVAKMLPCEHRLLLSGTPIQNNLKELWSLFDFVYPGR